MTLAFKTLYDTVTLDSGRRVVSRNEGEVRFQDFSAVLVSYSPAGSYSAESYPVYLEVSDGSRIEIANDAFGTARRAAVAAAETLGVLIHDASFGPPSVVSADEWSVPLLKRPRGIGAVPGLESPGEDLFCTRSDGTMRLQQKPGGLGRTLRRVRREARDWDGLDWSYGLVLGLCLLLPCLIVLPVALALYYVTQVVQGRPLLATLIVSPSEVRLGGGFVEQPPIPAGDVQDVGLFRQKGWRGRVRVQHLVVRSDDARLEFPVVDEAEAEWARQHVLAAMAAG